VIASSTEHSGRCRSPLDINHRLANLALSPQRGDLASVVADALQARGTDETAARLASEIGMIAFSIAFARWLAQENIETFGHLADTALAELLVSATTLDESSPHPTERPTTE
jgi:hypothetical protein